MNRTVFIGVRSGSTRSINKNVKPFLSDGTSLLQNRLLQLREVECNEIIVSTNCEVCKAQAYVISIHDERIKIINRSQDLCITETKVTDIMRHIANVSLHDNIMWTHVTAPFVTSETFNQAFKKFEDENEFDSVVSVNKLQNFIWNKDKNTVVNNFSKNNKWPNTQDLYPLYEFNHAFYICKKSLLENGERVGENPYLYECSQEASIDIDWESDFQYAQRVSKITESTRSLSDFYRKIKLL
jgi:CMP-N-acetylneuraminic acid synthetase